MILLQNKNAKFEHQLFYTNKFSCNGVFANRSDRNASLERRFVGIKIVVYIIQITLYSKQIF